MEFSEGGGISISESFTIEGPDAMNEMMMGGITQAENNAESDMLSAMLNF